MHVIHAVGLCPLICEFCSAAVPCLCTAQAILPDPANLPTAPAERPGLVPAPNVSACPVPVPQSRGNTRKRKAAAQLNNARAAPQPLRAWDEPSAGGHAELQQQRLAPPAQSSHAKKAVPKSHAPKMAPSTTATPAPIPQPKHKQAGSKVAVSERADNRAQTLQICMAGVKAKASTAAAKAAPMQSKQACKRQPKISLGDAGAPGSKAQNTQAASSPGHSRKAGAGNAGWQAQAPALATDAGAPPCRHLAL